ARKAAQVAEREPAFLVEAADSRAERFQVLRRARGNRRGPVRSGHPRFPLKVAGRNPKMLHRQNGLDQCWTLLRQDGQGPFSHPKRRYGRSVGVLAWSARYVRTSPAIAITDAMAKVRAPSTMAATPVTGLVGATANPALATPIAISSRAYTLRPVGLAA